MKRSDMKLTILPKSTLGKWSAGLGIAFIILITVKILGSLPLPTFFIAALGLAGFITGIVAIFKNRDRVILIFLSLIVGLIIILWTAAEFIFPH
jgi:hypothetical protein